MGPLDADARLTELLAAAPDAAIWARICELLEGARHHPDAPALLEVVDEALASWPDELRSADGASFAVTSSELPVWWPLARTLSMDGDGGHIERLLASPGLLRHFTDVSIVDVQSALDAIAGMERLRRLQVTNAGAGIDLRWLAGKANLKRLQLAQCIQDYDDLDDLASCASLEDLELAGNDGVRTLGPLAALTRLQTLAVRDFRALLDLEGFEATPRLRCLRLRGVPELRSVEPLGALRALEEIELWGARSLRSIAPLRTCAGLRRILVGGAGPLRLDSLGDLSALANLESLSVNGVTEALSLDGLAGTPALTDLVLSGEALSSVAPISRLPSLKRLGLQLRVAPDMAPLAGAAHLEGVELSVPCADLDFVATWGGVRTLRVASRRLRRLGALRGLRSLRELELDAPAVEDYETIGGLSDLDTLLVHNAANLRDATFLASLPRLRRVALLKVPGATRLPDLPEGCTVRTR